MTGYTVHTGSNEKFSESWDKIFKKKKSKAKAPAEAKNSAASSTRKTKKK